jgi:CO/xanthine dehydrogenase FAD-binding subunit
MIAVPSGTRAVKIDDFSVGPDKDILRDYILAPDEVMTAIHMSSEPALKRREQIKRACARRHACSS